MKKTHDYLTAVKKLTPTGTVYAAAQLLDLPEETVRAWDAGRARPDVTGCLRIAQALGIEPLQVITDIERERKTA